MAQVTNFFVGANSGEGFRNLFSEMVDVEDTYDFMVLKGGPGVGKNTFMREIGRAMEEAGTPVEYLWCSGDPDSLDGVVLPELRCAIADGTSPHGSVSKGRGHGPGGADALCIQPLLHVFMSSRLFPDAQQQQDQGDAHQNMAAPRDSGNGGVHSPAQLRAPDLGQSS